MHLLNVATMFIVFLLIGVELSVSAFINPVAWQLEPGAQAKALGLFAALFGKVMPFWYGACLLLLAAQAWLYWHTAAFSFMIVAAVLWLFVIVVTVAVLVPINNQIAARSAADWQKQHRTWDKLHRVRILLIGIAAFLLTYVLVR